MGKALQDGYRKRVFLMTKIDGARRRPPRGRLMSRCNASGPTALT